MSQENVEVVRRCFDLFAKGNYAATLESFDPAVETVEPDELPGAATYVGYEGLAEAFSHSSGVPVETTVAHVYAFEDGKIVRWRMINSGAEALRAVGLSE